MQLFVTKGMSEAVPVLHSICGSDMGDNAFGGAQVDAGPSKSTDDSLEGIELALISRAADTFQDEAEDIKTRCNTDKDDGE